MAALGRFSQSAVETLAKRSALICSRPGCGILTSGPTEDAHGAVNIGEAAHIYGISPSSARHNPSMSAMELADITNGVWLCRNCHKEIDNDETRFPADILFQWRREHERSVLQRLGHREELIREKAQTDRLKIFEGTTHLAQQIVLDRPQLWEYKLTIELLRSELAPLRAKWRALRDGLYVRLSSRVQDLEFFDWYKTKLHDVLQMSGAVGKLVNTGLGEAWGPPGQPGVDTDILHMCRLITAAARNALEWEEDVRFSRVPDEFLEVQSLLMGIAGPIIDELMRIPAELATIFESDAASGNHTVQLLLRMPDKFTKEHDQVLARCMKKFEANRTPARRTRFW